MQPKSTQISPGMTRSLLSRCGFHAEKKASRWCALTLRDSLHGSLRERKASRPLWEATAHRSSKQRGLLLVPEVDSAWSGARLAEETS